jgi:hypothetical protein
MRRALRLQSMSWSAWGIRSLALAVAGLTAAGCAAPPTPTTGAASRPAPSADAFADAFVDGFAIGPVRDTGSDAVFHQLEVAARGAWTRDHPGQAVSSFTVHHAGRTVAGVTQAGTDGPLTYLMVIDTPGGEHHALVLHCSPLTLFSLGDCR